MSCDDDDQWIEDRIAATKAMIIAFEDAILALSVGGLQQSYTLDTGQTRQVVTKADLGTIRNTLSSLENRLATLQARLRGSTTHVVPGF